MNQDECDQLIKALREFGLGYPGAHIKSPWPGHEDLAVRDKTFCYLPPEGQPFSISCKLPQSCDVALTLPFATPTGYGLGRSGWVSASFEDHEVPPIELFQAWIDESYRAQAPKRLIAELDGRTSPEGARPGAGKKTAGARKAGARKTGATGAKKTGTTKTATRKTAKTAKKKTAANVG